MEEQTALHGYDKHRRAIPKDHLLRKLKTNIDFDFIYEETREYYSNIDRPSIDLVCLKIVTHRLPVWNTIRKKAGSRNNIKLWGSHIKRYNAFTSP